MTRDDAMRLAEEVYDAAIGAVRVDVFAIDCIDLSAIVERHLKQPPGTTTPDVQAQVASPWWTMDDAAKARAQWQVGESEENWRARVLDAAVAAEQEALAKLADEEAEACSQAADKRCPPRSPVEAHEFDCANARRAAMSQFASQIRARSAQEKGEGGGDGSNTNG